MHSTLMSRIARAAGVWMAALAALPASAQTPGMVISEYLANPAGTDSPLEYVELVATRPIDFTVTPYTVVFANNGTATTNGWRAGAALTYAFAITTGNVAAGDVVYVGGSSMAPVGTKLRTIDTGTTAGDGAIGNANATGVLGNGGTNADGIAVFDVAVASLTSSTVPVDAIFLGTGTGTAVVSGGTAGYELPVNDRYTGGKLQSTSFFALDPVSGTPTHATGTLNTGSGVWTTTRTWANTAATAGTTITLTAAQPVLSISNVGSTNEGNGATTTFSFTVSLSAAAGPGGVTFDIATADGSATASSDYTARSLTSQTIPAGSSTYTFDVLVNGDTVFEQDEDFLVNVGNVVGATPASAQGQGSIQNDDAEPTLTATPANAGNVSEGNAGTTPVSITYSLSGLAQDDLTIDLHTADGSADAGDYNGFAMGDTITIPGGSLSVVYSDITVIGDGTIEPDETFTVIVDNYFFGAGRRAPTGVVLPTSTITIVNDDAVPMEFSIDNVTVTEGNAGTTNAVFTVTLANVPVPPLGGFSTTVDFATVDGSAAALSDFLSTSGSLSFSGPGTQTITVPIIGDLTDEIDETFTVALSNPSGATISSSAGTGTGTITDDDAAPTLSIADRQVVEGNVGTTNGDLTVTLSQASGQTVTVDYARSGGLFGPFDFTFAPGSLSFAPGETSKVVPILVNADTVYEPTLTQEITLSGASNAALADTLGVLSVLNDDAASDLGASIVDSPDPVSQGGAITYTITLSNAGPGEVAGGYFNFALPTGTTFVSLTSPAGYLCDTPAVGANGAIFCAEGSARSAPSAKQAASAKLIGNADFSVVANVDFAVPVGTLLTSIVTTGQVSYDANAANNTAPVSTLVGAAPVSPPIPTLDRYGQWLAALVLLAVALRALRRD